MEYKNYIVPKEIKIEDIARQFGLSIAQLKELNPQMRTFTNIWGTETYVSVQQVIKVPSKGNENPYEQGIDFDFTRNQKQKAQKLSEYEDILKKNHFDQKARYRCEQTNISRINNEVIILSANTYTEFLVKQSNVDDQVLEIDITDLSLSVDPIVYEQAFRFGQRLEMIKYPIILGVSKEGVSNKIYNIKDIQNKWEKFRDNELEKDDIYQQLKKQNIAQAKDLIQKGNKEFTSEKIMSDTLDKNLFLHTFFRALQGDYLPNYYIEQYSQLFPEVNLKTNIVRSKVKQDDTTTTYRLVGEIDKQNLSTSNLENMYNEIYKPMIKYSFTEFKTIYRITYTIENDTKFLTEAKISLSEKIKNNYEIITEMKIQKVEL